MNITKTRGIGIIILLAILVIVGLSLHSPIPQSLAYHNYADQRSWLGIPNFANVISNLPFTLIGLLGLYFLFGRKTGLGKHFIHQKERYAYLLFFIGIFFVGFGSTYYHLNPNNQSLVWDRLPMTVAFMAFFSAIVSERINYRLGLSLLLPLIILGIATVVYWHYTDDLRPYIFIQFFPLVALPLLLVLFPAVYTGTSYLVVALILYVIAKVFELADKSIFIELNGTISGHTLKHLTAALAIFCIYLYVARRRIK